MSGTEDIPYDTTTTAPMAVDSPPCLKGPPEGGVPPPSKEPPTTDHDGTRDLRARRRRLPLQHNNDFDPSIQPQEPAKKKTKTSRKNTTKVEKVEDVESEFDTQWICCECKEAECQMDPEATEMLVCDGPCRRLVHYPCAGLSAVPAEHEKFYCNDCTKGSHSCMICGEYGVDDVDVFRCAKSKCGLFFHESCLDMHNVKVELVTATAVVVIGVNKNDTQEGHASSTPKQDHQQQKQPRRVFACPTHACWTCSADGDAKETQASPADEHPQPVGTAATKIKKNKKKTNKRRGSKGSKAGLGAFESKSDCPLLRCVDCARSYHIKCIPPSAKFHELAVLCHEHAAARKLPELDREVSLQRALERKAQARVNSLRRNTGGTTSGRVNGHVAQPGRQPARFGGDNVFFRGIEGSNATSFELRLLDALLSQDEGATDAELGRNSGKSLIGFCLPCDMKDEVHSKPPGYKHVSLLQYQAGNKPPRLPQAGDVCGCVGVCDDNCINRTLYTECFGDASIVSGSSSSSSRQQLTNCSVGAGCGNRLLGQRKTAKCKPAPEEGRGWGLVALQKIYNRDLVVEYVGEVIDEQTKEQRLREWSKEHPNDTNFYIMALQTNWYIDARLVANTARFVNHSCDPNCILLPINVNGWSRCGIFALRDIEPGEFLSYDYHFDTQQTDKFLCCCGALNCRGTMNRQKLSLSRDSQVGDDWEVAKAEYQRDVKFLESRQMNDVTSLVGPLVPAASEGSKDEFVGNGPQKKHTTAARHNRIFLPRNAVIGYDLLMRRLGEDDCDGINPEDPR